MPVVMPGAGVPVFVGRRIVLPRLGVGDIGIGLPQAVRRGRAVVPVVVVGVPVLVGVDIVLPRLGVGDCGSVCLRGRNILL